MSKVIILDVETTSANPAKAGLIQLAGKIIIDGKVAESFNFKCKPYADSEVDPEGLKFLNLTPEIIAGYESPVETHKKFTAILGKYVSKYDKTDKFIFKAYNSRFDEEVLRRWFSNSGDEYYGSWFWNPSICIMQLAMSVVWWRRAKLKDFKLKTVAAYMGIQVDETKLHDADYDIHITEQLEIALNKEIRACYDMDKNFNLTI